jgi:hypothetical protein
MRYGDRNCRRDDKSPAPQPLPRVLRVTMSAPIFAEKSKGDHEVVVDAEKSRCLCRYGHELLDHEEAGWEEGEEVEGYANALVALW